MAKKVINEVNLQDMIAGLESSPAYSEYNEQILSGVLSANNKQTKPHIPYLLSSGNRKAENIRKNQAEPRNCPIKNTAGHLLKNTARLFCKFPELSTANLFLSAHPPVSGLTASSDN